MCPSHSRGQIIGSEFVLACVIFLLVLSTVLFLWQVKTSEITRAEILYDLDSSATDAIENLLRNPGTPSGWAQKDLDQMEDISIGLVNESRILDAQKVEKFIAMMGSGSDNPCGSGSNYECNKYLLGLKGYDFYFDMTYLDGSAVDIGFGPCVTGVMPNDPDYLLVKRRNAVLGDDIVNIKFYVWS